MSDERRPYASQLHSASSKADDAELDRRIRELLDEPGLTLEGPRTGKTKWGWVRFAMGMAVIGAMFGGVIVAALWFVDGPVHGDVKKASLEAARAAAAPKPEGLSTYTGKYVSFQYPRRFDLVSQSPSAGLEGLTLSSNSDHRRGVTISVRKMPESGLLHDDPSFRFREMNVEQYRPIHEKVNGEPVVVMSKLDRQEQTVFWPHKGLELTIAVMSTDPQDDVAAMLKEIQPTVRWNE